MTVPAFRLGYVTGTTPGKWARIWEERHPREPLELVPLEEGLQLTALREGTVDMALVRGPAGGVLETTGLHLIPLYDEVQVVVVPRDHVATAFDRISAADLVDELTLQPGPDLTVAQAVATVAAGTGVLVVPMSVARLHHRKDVSAVPVDDLATTPVGLAWSRPRDPDRPDPRVEEMVGIVRGRSVNSSRGTPPPATRDTASTKKTGQPARQPGKPGKATKGGRPAGGRGTRAARQGRGRRS